MAVFNSGSKHTVLSSCSSKKKNSSALKDNGGFQVTNQLSSSAMSHQLKTTRCTKPIRVVDSKKRTNKNPDSECDPPRTTQSWTPCESHQKQLRGNDEANHKPTTTTEIKRARIYQAVQQCTTYVYFTQSTYVQVTEECSCTHHPSVIVRT